jgi:glycosyltransferase involved in cell wall biosynthesis
MRTSNWLSALAPHAQVALVAPAGTIPPGSQEFAFYAASRSFARGARGAFTILRRGLPVQTLLAAPYEWGAAISAARRDFEGFDTTIVILSRIDPWVRGLLDGGTKILDAVDSLRRNAVERGNAASMLMRWFWRQEERRMARAEIGIPGVYDRVVVVSGEETSEFGPKAVAIANSVNLTPLDLTAPRRYDFGFWGRLAYFANADAALWLIDEIWPAILARNPAATCVIGGADAPASMRRAAERRGITLLSPVDDIATLARSVRVAIFPVRYGSGQSGKVLEAAEAGCAIVATHRAMRSLAPLVPHVRFAHDAVSFAEAALPLLETEARSGAAGALRRVVAANYSREEIAGQLARIAGVPSKAEVVFA